MPKPKHSLDEKYIKRLRQDLQSTLGMMVRNRPDADRISELVRQTHEVYISPSTFSRLFLNVSSSNHFYLDTLDKLASLTFPYTNWEDYCTGCQASEEQLQKVGVFCETDLNYNLVALNLTTSSWKPLHQLFDAMSGSPQYVDSYRFMYNFGELFHEILQRHPSSETEFYKRFIQYPVIRKSFIELNADPDFLLPNYIKGLDCYIKSIDNNAADAQNDLIFALCMQFYYHLKQQDVTGIQLCFKQISSKLSIETISVEQMHPFNIGRFLSVGIYHAFYCDDKRMNNKITDALHWVRCHNEQLDGYGIRVICHHLLEVLKHCKSETVHVEEVLSYLNVDLVFANQPEMLRQTIFNLEPSGIRWSRRFKQQRR